MKNFSVIILMTFCVVKISPQQVRHSEDVSKSEIKSFSDSLKKDALNKIKEKEKADLVVKNNKGYIENLEKKLNQKSTSKKENEQVYLVKKVTKKTKQISISETPKIDSIQPKKELEFVYLTYERCDEMRSFFGKILYKDDCKKWVLDSIQISK